MSGKAPTTVASLRDTEPDYRSLIATLGALRNDAIALVLLKIDVPLLSGSGTVVRGRSCRMAFFVDKRDSVGAVVDAARRYARDMHHFSTQTRARREGRCGDCAILSDASSWLFVDAIDGLPLVAAGDSAKPAKGTGARWRSDRAKALERRVDDHFYEQPLADAIDRGMLLRSPLDRIAAVQAVRGAEHSSRTCVWRARLARQMSTGSVATDAVCTCASQAAATCSECEAAIDAELEALLAAYEPIVNCRERDSCSCASDAAVRAAVRGGYVFEMRAVLRACDCAYAALGDDVYDQNSPLVARALASLASRGHTVPCTPLADFAVDARLLAAARRNPRRRIDLRGATYAAVRRATVNGATLAAHVVQSGEVRNRQPVERALEWLPPFAVAILRPYTSNGAYHLIVAQAEKLQQEEPACVMLAADGALERTLYTEVERDADTRRAVARVIALCVQTPTTYGEVLYLAAVLALMVHVLEFAAQTCRRRADVERRIASERERRERAAAHETRQKAAEERRRAKQRAAAEARERAAKARRRAEELAAVEARRRADEQAAAEARRRREEAQTRVAEALRAEADQRAATLAARKCAKQRRKRRRKKNREPLNACMPEQLPLAALLSTSGHGGGGGGGGVLTWTRLCFAV